MLNKLLHEFSLYLQRHEFSILLTLLLTLLKKSPKKALFKIKFYKERKRGFVTEHFLLLNHSIITVMV